MRVSTSVESQSHFDVSEAVSWREKPALNMFDGADDETYPSNVKIAAPLCWTNCLVCSCAGESMRSVRFEEAPDLNECEKFITAVSSVSLSMPRVTD